MVWQGFRLIVDNTKVQAILVPGGMGRRRGAMASSRSRLGGGLSGSGPSVPLPSSFFLYFYCLSWLLYGLMCLDR